MKRKRIISVTFIIALIITMSVPAYASQINEPNNICNLGINEDTDNSTDTDQVIVKFDDHTSAFTKFMVNLVCPIDSKKTIDGDTYAVEPKDGVTPQKVIDRYSHFGAVDYAELDSKASMLSTPNDTYYLTYQSSIFNYMNIPSAWDINSGNGSVVVAVLDTGIDFNHPELSGRILSGGYDFVNKDSDPSDDNGHGTMCAGIIAANTNNSVGIAGAANCKILPIKVLDSAGDGYVSDIAAGITYAADHGANIINLSLGTKTDSKTLQDAVNYAHDKGVAVIAGSGNSGGAITYPAADNNVVAVGSVTASGSLASYSCYGDKLDLVAVGDSVVSTYYSGSSCYALGSGTSYAAPFVSALGALELSVNPTLTPDSLESTMKDTAKDLGTSGWDQYYGAGCIDFYAALENITNGQQQKDTTAPVINLNGSSSVTMVQGDSYTDQGATAYDDVDGDLTSKIEVNNPVDTDTTGVYKVTYSVSDAAGNTATAYRTVTVKKVEETNTRPVITLNGTKTITLTVGDSYHDAGATAYDAEDGNLTDSIVTSGEVDTSKAGTYVITYSVSDSQGLAATTVSRTITVKNKEVTTSNKKPWIKLNGDNVVTLTLGSTYDDPGATASDAEDGDLTSEIVVDSNLDTSKSGHYKIIYSVTDSNNATTSVTRYIVVRANGKPLIKIKGNSVVAVKLGSEYVDAGATAIDQEDGDLTSKIVVNSTVDTSTAGSYKVIYSVTDSSGATTSITRNVNVK